MRGKIEAQFYESRKDCYQWVGKLATSFLFAKEEIKTL